MAAGKRSRKNHRLSGDEPGLGDGREDRSEPAVEDGTEPHRLGGRARDRQRGDPLRPARRDGHRDVSAERQPDHDRPAADRLALDDPGDVGGRPVDA